MPFSPRLLFLLFLLPPFLFLQQSDNPGYFASAADRPLTCIQLDPVASLLIFHFYIGKIIWTGMSVCFLCLIEVSDEFIQALKTAALKNPGIWIFKHFPKLLFGE